MDSPDPKQAAMELLQSLIDDSNQLEKLITHPKGLIFDNLGHTQRHFPRVPDPSKLFSISVTPLNTKLKVERDLKSGAMLGFYEVETPHVGQTSKTSTSMHRAPGPYTENVKGSSTNFPFWPGGMDDPTVDSLIAADELGMVDFENDLETTPPGFDSGMNFDIPNAKLSQGDDNLLDNLQLINEANIAKLLDDSVDDHFYASLDSQRKTNVETEDENDLPVEQNLNDETNAIIDDIAPKISSFEVLNISQESDRSELSHARTGWAEILNVNKPIVNFHTLVPSMARTWPFELDTFQKQAIICLERHDSVFVAAHTSAGKTVVAEYAVALSLRHMTKTIYTSPIKALSNQKFRDFKNIFKDVGLITGDVQINSEASCLIMTTEILRSMLYNGSDTIRDVEWVIFDEVHYINDAERGVVWEEVLILLPNHINIVLLSATVPNALEFADWIGRTKRKKIYVISTPKRPVPLEHYLYYSNNVKSQNELYTVVDAEGNFSIVGYNSAKEAHDGKKNNTNARSGISAYPHSLTPKQESTIWMKLLNLLKKKEQLPVVAFTLSRKSCDQNAQILTTVDLTTSTEKNKIHQFLMRSLNRLKAIDRGIPQVQIMQDLLKRGIGVHHSGILPILKEVVEMLFQEGLVKLLFATETFAMGVNMPARTVVFDSITKFDGKQRRNLRAEEYIQMAGRAGRRGLDAKGMVIILCKAQFPDRSDLELMIKGKPTTLESRFRLTYAMILNLMRVEKLRVEEMMKRSFFEIDIQRNAFRYEDRLKMLYQQASSLQEIECEVCRPSIEDYCIACVEYVKQLKAIQKLILSNPHGIKVLSPGRLVVIATKAGVTALGIILKSKKSVAGSKTREIFEVLVAESDDPTTHQLNDDSSSNSSPDPLSLHILNALKINVYIPQMPYKYDVVSCTLDDIICITRDDLHIDGDKVFKDWDKRQMPRFRDDPPNQAFEATSKELLNRLQDPKIKHLAFLDPTKDLHIKDVDICEKWAISQACHQLLTEYSCINCTDFQKHLKVVCHKKKVKDELNDIKHRLSDESLQLLPEYKARVNVLKQLRYIDDSEVVLLKGRVACEISNHELVTTELVFENTLAKFQPEEIAALLSCMVCQEKRHRDSEEVVLPENLTKGKEEIKRIIQRVGEIQQFHQIPDEDFDEQFRFELVEVVYEWAKGMPFAEIMSMTEIQEGIIVRCIQRLDEILRDVKDAARIVGDPILYKKAEASSQAIKRDIVFAASLYTQ